jgi:hypothetical protein
MLSYRIVQCVALATLLTVAVLLGRGLARLTRLDVESYRDGSVAVRVCPIPRGDCGS